MSTFKNPVGPQPSTVYWRRRLIVGLGALVVILVIVLIIVRPGAGASDTDPNPTGDDAAVSTDDQADGSDGAEGTDDAAAAPPAAADGVCAAENITVEAKTDATTYAPGVSPMISLSVTNSGDTACLMNVGSDVQEYRITSGEELIWSSKDCQSDPVALQQELQPGVPVDSTPFPWDRTRSDAAACDAERTPVTGEGASYHLSAIINGVTSEDTKQFVLN
ncbi:hypothetical protein B0I08_10652 [Glaciihabitans tibetensis]|uniref:DUF4232 domain-containing protein n=1 Tax=Glaciihabitans tibetensis TaxID=1266600 RepID=A0A2T0VB68_9MICO|nr:hypothetical protein [Glaciihabitans tibetensis]PRY67446.1 hypothetical protein B0I08_10652 [Glaciihabitans tibetensis]